MSDFSEEQLNSSSVIFFSTLVPLYFFLAPLFSEMKWNLCLFNFAAHQKLCFTILRKKNYTKQNLLHSKLIDGHGGRCVLQTDLLAETHTRTEHEQNISRPQMYQ